MFGFRCDRSRRPRRGFTAALAILGVTACSLGVPLPALVVKRASQPYPCEHHACGCVDAEHCWRDCCCMTNRQKLAWAHSHGVTPPEFVAAAAQRETAAELAGADHVDGPAKHACCAAARAHLSEHDHNRGGEQGSSSSKFTLMILALRCHGVSVSAGLLPPCLPVTLRACASGSRQLSAGAPRCESIRVAISTGDLSSAGRCLAQVRTTMLRAARDWPSSATGASTPRELAAIVDALGALRFGSAASTAEYAGLSLTGSASSFPSIV